jgi:hypothetical protein
MSALNALITKENQWSGMFNSKFVAYEVATAAGRRRVAEMIDAKLSPENLTCDGELPPTEVNRRYRELTSAARELIRLDPTVSQFMYEFA